MSSKIRIVPTQVIFDKEDYDSLQDQIEGLQKELEETKAKAETQYHICDEFFKELGKIIDLTEVDMSQIGKDYHLVLQSGASMLPKLMLYYKNQF